MEGRNGIIGLFVQIEESGGYYNIMDKFRSTTMNSHGADKYLGIDNNGNTKVIAPGEIIRIEDKEVVDRWVRENTILYEIGVMNRENWQPIDNAISLEEAQKHVPEQELTQGSLYVIRAIKGDIITVLFYWVASNLIENTDSKGHWVEYKDHG